MWFTILLLASAQAADPILSEGEIRYDVLAEDGTVLASTDNAEMAEMLLGERHAVYCPSGDVVEDGLQVENGTRWKREKRAYYQCGGVYRGDACTIRTHAVVEAPALGMAQLKRRFLTLDNQMPSYQSEGRTSVLLDGVVVSDSQRGRMSMMP